MRSPQRNYTSRLLTLLALLSLLSSFFANAMRKESVVHGSSARDIQPQQIHLSLTGNLGEMVVMWMTNDDTDDSQVQYWPASSGQNSTSRLKASGNSDHYYLVIPPYESPQIHWVYLTGLMENTKYYYVCGDPTTNTFSSIYWFTTEVANSTYPTPENPLVIASVADHGTSPDSQQVVNALMKYHTSIQPFNFLIHSGDISYANDDQKYWDIWGNMVQPFASQVPWMVAVGNHEILDDLFVAYQYRFTMPSTEANAPEGNLFYSFNYGNVHVIPLSSEFPEYWHIDEQYQWLENDLKNVDRKQTPWIISLWHSPWYCSNKDHYGSGDDMRDSYEDLFYKYKVDLVVNGHVHAYERTKPVYKGKVTPDAPVYITNGIGGTEEGLATRWYTQPNWSVYRQSHSWGFGAITIFNSTHLHWEMRRDNDTMVEDEFWLIRQH
jgi:predicted MPP superfamily phosphohydrolase